MFRDARDGGQDLGPALQGLLRLEPLPDLGVDDLQLALDLPQPLLVEPLAHGSAQVLAAIGGGDPVLQQRVADLLEFGKIALSLRTRLSRAQILDGRRHGGQNPGVHGIGLGAPAQGAGEGTDLEGIDRVEGESGLQEGILEVAAEGSGGFVRDPVDLGADPGDQLPEAGPVIREPGCFPLGRGERVEPVLGDVDPDGCEGCRSSVLPFLLCLSCEPQCSCIHSGRREGRWRPKQATPSSRGLGTGSEAGMFAQTCPRPLGSLPASNPLSGSPSGPAPEGGEPVSATAPKRSVGLILADSPWPSLVRR